MIANENVLSIFMKVQDILRPDIVVEVGAHDGDFAKAATKLEVNVFAFEASVYVYERFKDSMAGITYLNLAVSDKTGTVKFEVQPNLDPSTTGNNSIKNRNSVKNYSYIDVDSVSIESFFNNTEFSNGALWIDAEGSSREVLLGAGDRIKDFSSIYIELETEDFWLDSWKRNEVIEFLESKGFYLFHEVPCYSNQSDAIFIRNDCKKDVNKEILY